MASPHILIFSLLLSCSSAVSSLSRGLKEGSSISVEQANDVFTSADGTFSAGFHPVGNNAYCFAIWFNKPPCTTHNCTIVWMANRDFPVNGKHSKLTLLRSGNLVLKDAGHVIVWKADTPLNKNTKLVSSRSRNNFSLGFFTLYFDPNNVLNLVYQSPEVSTGRSMYNTSGIAVLCSFGDFSSTDGVNFFPSDFGSIIQRMLKLDFDGNLRLYSRKGRENWVVSWQAFSRPCRIHGSCGPKSVLRGSSACSYVPNLGRQCSCIPGYKMMNPTDWTFGCEPKFDLPCNQADEFAFLKLSHVEFYGYDFGLYPNYTIKMCEDLCLSMCDCKGFQFKHFEVHRSDGDMYLKLPKVSLSSFNKAGDQDYKLDCSTKFEELGREYPKSHESESLKLALWSAGAIGIVEILSIFFVLWLLIRTRQHSGPVQGYFLATSSIRRFTYAELKKATKSFTEEIGRGIGVEAEFLVEVDNIGRLHHMNVIEMWSYCMEGKYRLLIYEYMEHGSLAKSLSFQSIDWRNRFEIAIGTAKGLAYLHEECLEWVLHYDIKLENILLDSRVTDFGLSWLLNRGDVKYSGFSRIRGTRGYMAPEWVSNYPITSKVDVYRYRIVVLVLVTGRNPGMGAHSSEDGEGGEDQTSLVKWVKEQMKRSTEAETWTGCKDMLDPTLDGKCDIDEMLILVTITLKCVQEDKDDRPTMGQVVEMLACCENNFAAKALSIARSLTHAL
ncbi:hypothetical protein E1A91_A01G101300v1 [Gossypium mustelinum]|uniref:Receptor-like serine/threonine-protein kinase n=1 Tax=Gossypium mustelinum TaxID=34275 RepID=A0A5D3AF64_GOSMU|nr:hypothetical protein E1A91_A01G101300v1 [Gossypium mustelinum]